MEGKTGQNEAPFRQLVVKAGHVRGWTWILGRANVGDIWMAEMDISDGRSRHLEVIYA